MRLPRRVPWAHIGELEQVCMWIYADEGDSAAKTRAIDRLSAWKAATSLPHALDSILAILAARALDASRVDTLNLRQTYAVAVIRMVNGLVDPLQSGAYARSIAAIATQLGLPSWFVELRHAATHEDLPSLELLREAGRESLSWLLHNYFHPTLNPSVPTSAPSSPRPVEPFLKSYKLLIKAVVQDTSLRKQHQDQINAVIRDIERWIAETKVSAELVAHPLGWDNDDTAVSRVDIKEKWALEILCDAFLEKGGIVPVSKKKCCAPAHPFLPTAASLALWSPLLVQLHANNPSFPSVFINRILLILLEDSIWSTTNTDLIDLDSKSLRRDILHSEYLARWATWAARTWTDESEHGTDLRREIILQVALVFLPGYIFGPKAKVFDELLQAVSDGARDLEESVELLRSMAAAVPSSQPWQPHDLASMEDRLETLLANERPTPELFSHGSSLSDNAPEGVQATGWKLLDSRSSWVPCPIGVYCSETK